MIFTKKIYFTTISFFFTYLILILPFNILNHLFTGISVLNISSFIICGFFYIFLIFFFKTKSSFFFRFLVYQAMGIGFISFNVSLPTYLIHLFTSINSFYLGLFCITLIFLLTSISLYNGRTIKEKKVKVYSSKVKKNYKFIFISDVHLGSNSVIYLKKIIKRIEDIKYDVLIIGGDLVDLSSFKIEYLETFKTVKKKILYVTGNHEFYLKNSEKIFRSLTRNKIKIIDSKKFQIDDLNIIGIGDNTSSTDQLNLIKKLKAKNKFNLLVIHKPIFWDKIGDKIDLMLSGHTHNGQIFPFNFLVKLKYKYIYGMYHQKNSSLYVSSGVGCWGPKMRLGTQNEIVSVFIKKKK